MPKLPKTDFSEVHQSKESESRENLEILKNLSNDKEGKSYLSDYFDTIIGFNDKTLVIQRSSTLSEESEKEAELLF